jgi:hypothetical protein
MVATSTTSWGKLTNALPVAVPIRILQLQDAPVNDPNREQGGSFEEKWEPPLEDNGEGSFYRQEHVTGDSPDWDERQVSLNLSARHVLHLIRSTPRVDSPYRKRSWSVCPLWKTKRKSKSKSSMINSLLPVQFSMHSWVR